MGFGYRAAYIAKTAQHIKRHHSSHYLHDLRRESYEHARAELLKLHGVGGKVSIPCANVVITDSISKEGNAIDSVCLSVCPFISSIHSVSPSTLSLNQGPLTLILCVCMVHDHSLPVIKG